MTPEEHRTAAGTELAETSPSPIEMQLRAERAEVHAILANRAGTGADYTAAEQLLSDSYVTSAQRSVLVSRARAFATLATA